MKRKSSYVLGLGMYAMIVFGAQETTESEITSSQKFISSDSSEPITPRNRWLQRIDTRKMTQGVNELAPEESFRPLYRAYKFNKKIPGAQPKSTKVHFGSKEYVEPVQDEGDDSVEYQNFNPTLEHTARSTQELQRRQIPLDTDQIIQNPTEGDYSTDVYSVDFETGILRKKSLAERLADRKKRDEFFKRLWEFQQKHQENMTEEELKDFWQAQDKNNTQALIRIQEKMIDDMKAAALKTASPKSKFFRQIK
ncbi:MAG TPA: hypothetical protein VLG50_03390 [Candidatus Saccharimonadales bacterium]|nr:hypothetical protein [Candidatus Saccharimonadales bacterium]